jgi:hypothetical protein
LLQETIGDKLLIKFTGEGLIPLLLFYGRYQS